MRALLLAMPAWALMGASVALASTLDFAVVPGSDVTFRGADDTFEFVEPAGEYDFQVTGPVGTPAYRLYGNIGGVFTIGEITRTPMAIPPGAVSEWAPVTGVGAFSIDDGAGGELTATLVWRDIYTCGTGGNLNTLGTMNLTDIVYGGSNAELVQLRDAIMGGVTASFTFIPAKSLTDLTTAAETHSTSYSGAVVPEPGALLLLGSGLVGLAALRRRAGRA